MDEHVRVVGVDFEILQLINFSTRSPKKRVCAADVKILK